MNQMPRTVLFLSTGDAMRGIMAEALLRQKGGERFTAFSAGYQTQTEVDKQALTLLDEAHISTAGLYSKNWKGIFLDPRSLLVDIIVTLSEEARLNCPDWPGDPIRVHWPVDDPAAAATPDVKEWKLRKCFATLENRVAALTKQREPQSPIELMLQLRSIAAVV